jgi:hypothetical protein
MYFNREIIRMRCPLLQEAAEILDDCATSLVNFETVIPEPLYQDPALRQVAITGFVQVAAVWKAVTASVEFHGKSGFGTVEIEKVGSFGMLPSKLVSGTRGHGLGE